MHNTTGPVDSSQTDTCMNRLKSNRRGYWVLSLDGTSGTSGVNIEICGKDLQLLMRNYLRFHGMVLIWAFCNNVLVTITVRFVVDCAFEQLTMLKP